MRPALQADGIVEEKDVTAGALIMSHGVRVVKSATTSRAAPWVVARSLRWRSLLTGPNRDSGWLERQASLRDDRHFLVIPWTEILSSIHKLRPLGLPGRRPETSQPRASEPGECRPRFTAPHGSAPKWASQLVAARRRFVSPLQGWPLLPTQPRAALADSLCPGLACHRAFGPLVGPFSVPSYARKDLYKPQD